MDHNNMQSGSMRMKRTFLILLPLLGMISGCFHSTDKKMASNISSPGMEYSLQKAESSHLFTHLDLEDSWWLAFQDMQLNDLMELAITASPTLQKAEAKILAAQADAKSIRSSLFPNLNAGAEDTWQYLSKYGLFRDFFPSVPGFPVPSKFNETDLSLNFSYEVDFWGKNRKMLQAALGIALAEEMEKSDAKLILSSTLAFTYYSWQAHLAELILYKKELAYEEELLALLQSRYQVGVDRVIPSLERKEERLALLQTIEDLEKNLLIDEIFLKNLMGQGPDYPLNLIFTWNPSEQKGYLPDTLNIDLLANRPDVKARILRVEAARQEIGVAKTEFYPNVNLMAFAGLSSLSFSHLFDWGSRTGNLSPAIHLPLFTAGKLQANLLGKVANFNEAVYSYNELLLQAAKEVTSEITTFISLHNQIEEQEKRTLIQKELLTVAFSCFIQGIDPYSNVLISKKELLYREIYEVQLRQSKILSAIRIIRAIGGGVSKKETLK